MHHHRAPGLTKLATIALLLAGEAGCVEAAVHEKTARELDSAMRASAYKDQQIRGLAWQVSALQAELGRARAESLARQQELAQRLDRTTAERAACAEELARVEAARRELQASLPGADAKGGRGRPDDVRRLRATLEAQNAKLLERLDRLERKLAASPASPGRPAPKASHAVGDVVDPWGFGSRK
jgi:chaperonin cofactor prefoldin